MNMPYDAKKSLQSLLGYGKPVHKRSGGICQYCGYGIKMEASTDANFDVWRQLTVEHFISKKAGGYLHAPKSKSRLAVEQQLRQKFPEISTEQMKCFVNQIDEANTVTACQFCNSMTSWGGNRKDAKTMKMLLDECTGTPEEVMNQIKTFLTSIFIQRRQTIEDNLKKVKDVFQKEIEAELKDKNVQSQI